MISPGNWLIDFTHPVLDFAAVILLVSLLLTLRAVAQRLFHRRPLRALLIMLLNVVAFSTVLILLLEPQHRYPGEESVVLITEGAATDLDTSAITSKLYLAPGAATSAELRQNFRNDTWLLDIAQLNLREPALASIKVLGYGLTRNQWENFANDIPIDFKPPPVDGFTDMQWQRSLVAGELLRISGRYQRTNPEAIIQIRLLDPAENIVGETRISSGQGFSLATRLKARGQLEYRLQGWTADQMQSEQLVPLEVVAGPLLNIMIEQSAPSFETRQLQNHLAAYGHRILINTDISKGKSIIQTTHLPDGAKTTLSPQTLAQQDVLIMDGRALTRLSGTQQQWLMDAIENGLGLLLLADSALLDNFSKLNTNLLRGFDLSQNPDAETRVIPRLMTGLEPDWQASLTAQPIKLSATNAVVLIDDSHDRTLVVNRATGLGNITLSLLSHSNIWLTSGNRTDWSEFWAALIATVARQPGGSLLLPPASTDFYRVNQRIPVCALSAEKDLSVSVDPLDPEGLQTVFELVLAADSLRSNRQCAYFWPQSSGWHQIQLRSRSSATVVDQTAVYIYQSDQWMAQQRDERVKASRQRSENSQSPRPTTHQKWKSEPINVFWLWLILILTATVLWLERKLDFG